jgi:hypothetical protein
MIPCRHEVQEIEKVGLKIQRLTQNGHTNFWLHFCETHIVPSFSTDNVYLCQRNTTPINNLNRNIAIL